MERPFIIVPRIAKKRRKPGRYRDPEARKLYMRYYMRKYRALKR
jgi:hypothetical protein